MSSQPPAINRQGKEVKSSEVNLYDAVAVQMELDESVKKFLSKTKGLKLDMSLSNLRLLLTGVGTLLAVIAQFYPGKFPENWWALIVCCPLFMVVNFLVTYWLPRQEEDILCQLSEYTGDHRNIRSRLDTQKLQYEIKCAEKKATGKLGTLFTKKGQLKREEVEKLVTSILPKK